MSLSQVLPVLQQMGVEVIDERPYEIEPTGGPEQWVYDFGLRYPAVEASPDLKPRFQETFAAVWGGLAEGDGFNALVLHGGLTWREVVVLRAYAKYLRQTGSTFSQEYLEQCLRNNLHLTRLLVQLFEARFDPDVPGDRREIVAALEEEIGGALDDVASLDQDRIMRSFLALINATLRTNYFQPAADDAAQALPVGEARPAAHPDAAAAAAAVRDLGVLARTSRACTCGSARSPAAGCAGPTGARTSAPRSSAWSRRRRSRTPSSCRSAPRAASW